MMCNDLIQSMRHLTALAAAMLALPLAAAPVVKTEHVEARLVTERASAQPGKPLTVGLQLRMEPHWHTYWKNPGDSGLPTKIQWQLPAGWKAGAIQWPYPKPLPIGPLVNYGYEDEVVLLTELTPPANATGAANVKASAEWLVCKDVCIPEKGELNLAIPVSAQAGAPDPSGKIAIERARANLPGEPAGWKFSSAVNGKTLVVHLAPPKGSKAPAKAMFFPERENLIETAAPQKLVRDGGALRIEMKLVEPLPTDLRSVSGVAVAEDGWQGAGKAIEVVAPVGKLPALAAGGGSTTSTTPDDIGGSVFVALSFAFLGGILLNLMPCVFPVLGIKVMGFVEHAHGDTRAMRLQGLVFAAGVLVSFVVLAGVMLAFRGAGSQLGWGFQLQSPAFVMLLAALFFVLALNLSGVFEWGAFAQSMTSDVSAKGRYADAFLAGVLASVVATPCTAPFMGAAVGFTLSQSAPVAMAIFAMLGIGMALPVLVLAFAPRLLKVLPRPGAWMETFKQVLAFPLYATVGWLVWVIGAQNGNDAVLQLLIGLVLIAMGAWVYGRWGHSGRAWHPVFALLLAAAGIAVAWPRVEPETPGASASSPSSAPVVARAGELPWQAWSPELVRDLTEQGRPVFVDFTAAWCVTCQVNKRVALHNAEVIRAFAGRGVVPLRADWTRQDPRITATLAELGRNAIPVYALYIPGERAPRLLPEVLTPTLILAELSKLPAVTAPPMTARN
jgi:thiol:disulfide interchange protein DsbD